MFGCLVEFLSFSSTSVHLFFRIRQQKKKKNASQISFFRLPSWHKHSHGPPWLIFLYKLVSPILHKCQCSATDVSIASSSAKHNSKTSAHKHICPQAVQVSILRKCAPCQLHCINQHVILAWSWMSITNIWSPGRIPAPHSLCVISWSFLGMCCQSTLSTTTLAVL